MPWPAQPPQHQRTVRQISASLPIAAHRRNEDSSSPVVGRVVMRHINREGPRRSLPPQRSARRGLPSHLPSLLEKISASVVPLQGPVRRDAIDTPGAATYLPDTARNRSGATGGRRRTARPDRAVPWASQECHRDCRARPRG
jgi:hypothetical protein